MSNQDETLRPEIKALVEFGNGVGGTEVSAKSRVAIKKNLLKAFAESKERLQPDKK